MLIFAIETSCDETAAAVVEDGRIIRSSVVSSQIELHRLYGGVVPELASRRHIEDVLPVAQQALKEAGVTLAEVDGVAVTAWPGLIGALLVGVNFAKGAALAVNKPLIPVHHLRSHIASNYFCSDLTPPFLALVVSGGHTSLIEVTDYTTFRTVGRTRDDAAGECFDKVARVLGLPYPGGVEIDKLSREGDPTAYRFPSASVKDAPLDFSFSGLKTFAVNTLHTASQRGQTVPPADFAASLSAAVASTLTEKTLLAARETGQKKIAVAGGVSANSVLRATLSAACEKEGLQLYLPEKRLCGDNAAMVGAQGCFELKAGHTAGPDLNALAVRSVDLG